MRFSITCVSAMLVASSVMAENAAAQDFQYGEAIVGANQAAVDAPVRRHYKALWFELSNLRNDTSRLGVSEIALDFRRTAGEAGLHEVVMVVKSGSGRREFRSIGPSPFAEPQGTVRGASWFGGLRGVNDEQIEVWLEQPMHVGIRPLRMKVSKSLTLGNVGQVTLARHWTQEEEEAFRNWEKSMTPPPPPPTGYQLAKPDTRLMPGMPILAGWMGAWQAAEVIDVRRDEMVLVKYSDATSVLVVRPRDWIAVEGKTLEAGSKNPSQFKASVRVLPGGTTPVPDDCLPIDAGTPLVNGAPLKGEWAGKWWDLTVLEVHKDGKVRIHWDKFSNVWDEDRERSTMLIAKDTLETLKRPDAAEKFAQRAEVLKSRSVDPSFSARRRRHDYPIHIALPKTAVRVTQETPLEKGVKLACSWAQKWYDVTVLEVNDDGTVKIHWDQFDAVFDADISRECLVIDKDVLSNLEAKSKTVVSAPRLGNAVDGGDRFKVVLKEFGENRIDVIKAVMEITGLNLKDAKEFVDAAPITIKQNLPKADAIKIRQDLQKAGGSVAIELQ